MRRKTFDVATLKRDVNERLRASTCSPEARFAMASVLATVLHATGNYNGFKYIELEGKDPADVTEFDESRRFYF